MKNRKVQWLVLIVAIAMVTALVAGCGGGDKKPAAPAAKSDAPKISGKLMIYTSIYPDIIEGVKPAIKKAFPDLDVQWFQAGTEKVITKLTGEIEAKKVQAAPRLFWPTRPGLKKQPTLRQGLFWWPTTTPLSAAD